MCIYSAFDDFCCTIHCCCPGSNNSNSMYTNSLRPAVQTLCAGNAGLFSGCFHNFSITPMGLGPYTMYRDGTGAIWKSFPRATNNPEWPTPSHCCQKFHQSQSLMCVVQFPCLWRHSIILTLLLPWFYQRYGLVAKLDSKTIKLIQDILLFVLL